MNRSVKVRGLAMLTVATLSASACGAAVDSDASSTVAAAPEREAATVASTITEYSVVTIAEPVPLDQGAVWDELLPTLEPEYRTVLPDSSAFTPTWWFSDIERSESQAVAADDDGCPSTGTTAPARLTATFELARPLDPELYREGSLQVSVSHDADPTMVAAYAAHWASVTDCLATELTGGKTLVRITDGLPEHAIAGYRIDFGEPARNADGTEISADMAVVQLVQGATYAMVVVTANQPVAHPDWIDASAEAIRVAGALHLDA